MFEANRVCSLLGVSVPIVQAGMVWASGWRLASAVSNAGGLGLLGAGSMSPELLAEHIAKCKAATDRPFGVNLPLLYHRVEEQIQVALAGGVRIFFTSAGNPKLVVPRLKDAGCTVVHVVPGARFAEKAQTAGCDAVVAEGFEAGGHNGAAELTTMVLIPMVRKATDLPIIAAGGIATGAGMLAAMALGADGVQVGTRFVATPEASSHPNFKEAVVAAGEDATRLQMKQLVPVRLLRNAFADAVAAAEARGASKEELIALLGKGRAKKGMFEGDMADGELEIGQVAGLIDQLTPAAEIVKEMVAEYASLKSAISAGGKW